VTPSTFETKLARFKAVKHNNRVKPEAFKKTVSTRRIAVRKLREALIDAKSPRLIAELSNALAKLLAKPKPPKTKRVKPASSNTPKEPTINDLVAVMEKKRKGIQLSEAEEAMVAGVENGKGTAY
jgi:hypothetical protein